MKVFVIGTGNVSYSLVPALIEVGCEVAGVYGRNAEKAQQMGAKYGVAWYCEHDNIPNDADIYIICTSDAAIAEVSLLLTPNMMVVHTSGTTDIDILSNRFAHCGVIYPVQTFTKGIRVDFSKVPLLTEWSNDIAHNAVATLANMLSNDVRPATSLQRRYLHLGAVMACNFTNHLFTLAYNILNSRGIDFALLKPLVEATIAKAMTHNPAECQTGPAARNDTDTISKHLDMLADNPDVQTIYKLITQNIHNNIATK